MLPDTKPQLLSREDFDAGKNLYYRLVKKKITFEEFEKECAYFAMSCGFNELVPHPYPTRPQELIYYDNCTFGEKKVLNEKVKFWEQPQIKNYLNAKFAVRFRNMANKKWLQRLLKVFEENNDYAFIKRVKERIRDFDLLRKES